MPDTPRDKVPFWIMAVIVALVIGFAVYGV
jgi:hypothetical protein